jgi:hypothetical protein
MGGGGSRVVLEECNRMTAVKILQGEVDRAVEQVGS